MQIVDARHCRHCQSPLSMSLAGVTHCRTCERQVAVDPRVLQAHNAYRVLLSEVRTTAEELGR
jgi:uncharacterized Zn finger protein (UPF0148 family)